MALKFIVSSERPFAVTI